MVKKKYKLKKEPLIRLITGLVVCIIVLSVCINYYNGRFERRLKKIGYTGVQINILKDHKVSLKTVSKYKYIEEIAGIVENENYQEKNLSKYLDKYVSKQDIDTVIYMVNNNLDYEYSDKLVNIIHEEYFIPNRLDRYMKYDKSTNSKDIVAAVNSNIDFDYYTNTNNTDVSKGKLMLVNKYYSLNNDYECNDLVKVENMYANLNDNKLNREAYEALKELIVAADKEGYNIRINYSYRDYETQEGIYNGYKESKGEEYADNISARPGFSEHQTGYAVDVGVQAKESTGKAFKNTGEYKWMLENSYKYGYILRYPENKTNITGYGFEAWHYRYVGKDVALYIHEHGITFDEYYAYFVENK